jgi:putative endonuclease
VLPAAASPLRALAEEADFKGEPLATVMALDSLREFGLSADRRDRDSPTLRVMEAQPSKCCVDTDYRCLSAELQGRARRRDRTMSINNSKQALGKEGERIAEQYLKRKGYKLIERNYRCVLGELDLIVLDRRVLVFVEVKTRTDHGFGSPLEAVEFRKQQKMIKVAQYFLSQKGLHQREARFDVVGISGPRQQPVVEHIENAFELP